MAREIPLTRGQVALVDDEDFELVSRYTWQALWCKETRSFYAHHGQNPKVGSGIVMARLILGLDRNSPLLADHRNHDTLDNRRENLRVATRGENQHNRLKIKGTSSCYKGVSLRRKNGKWIAYISLNNKRIQLGNYFTQHDAARAYNEAAKKYFGEFAKLNEVSHRS